MDSSGVFSVIDSISYNNKIDELISISFLLVLLERDLII